jgi:NAD(P)-dependent dehydrogenase (short-subunit alcohol dehydrogenase family)
MLNGKIALITGATAGIGAATAALFAERGAKLVLTGRNEAAGAQLAATHGAVFVGMDITTPGAAEHLVFTALQNFGRLDILVNNAGALHRGDAVNTTDAQWDNIMAVNVSAVFKMSRAAIPVMRAQKSGAIINIASDWGLIAAQAAAAYGASKGAIVQLTGSMAADHARDGIRVNAVCPGDTDTQMLDPGTDPARATRLQKLADAIPLGRVGQARDVAAAIAFLASDDAAFITGAMLPVDGGNSAV